MSAPAITAPKTGGFSMLRAVAPLIHAMSKGAKGEKLIGAAVCHLIFLETGITVGASGRFISAGEAAEMSELAGAIRAVFGLSNRADNGTAIGPHHGADDGADDGADNGADNGNPMGIPQTPFEGKKEGKEIPSSLPSSGGKKGFSSVPSFDEWKKQADSIGWNDPIAVKDSYDWKTQSADGWADVKSWKRLCSCLANNWKSKAAKAERFAHLAGAFGTKTEAAK